MQSSSASTSESSAAPSLGSEEEMYERHICVSLSAMHLTSPLSLDEELLSEVTTTGQMPIPVNEHATLPPVATVTSYKSQGVDHGPSMFSAVHDCSRMPYWKQFFSKMKGDPSHKRHRRSPAFDVLMGLIGGFLGISFVAALHYHVVGAQRLIIASFGASAVLVYGVITSPLAQPRNLVLGHLVSALVGLTIRVLLTQALSEYSQFTQAVLSGASVGIAIALMYVTESVHPPGGATALITLWLKDNEVPAGYGYWFLIFPVLTGTLCMLAVALITNNIPRRRRYPVFWW
eukprot:ANDGO_05765.mRNA.1 Transmembrane protein DDB_G0273707/DDB_G0273361